MLNTQECVKRDGAECRRRACSAVKQMSAIFLVLILRENLAPRERKKSPKPTCVGLILGFDGRRMALVNTGPRAAGMTDNRLLEVGQY